MLLFAPPIVLLLCLFVAKIRLMSAVFATYMSTILLYVVFADISVSTLVVAHIHGWWNGLSISLIVFGALFFYTVMNLTGKSDFVNKLLDSISPDKTIQVLLVAWFMGSFFEGITGFGIPMLVVIPPLINLGIPRFKAVVLALIANSSAVAFGAVGTPVTMGLNGLEFPLVSGTIGVVVGGAALFVPTILILLLALDELEPITYIKAKLHYALVAGVCFAVPFVLISSFAYQLSSILAALIGGGGFCLYVRLFDSSKKVKVDGGKEIAWLCGLFILLVIFSNYLNPLRIQIGSELLLFNPLHPGVVFCIVSSIGLALQRMPISRIQGLGSILSKTSRLLLLMSLLTTNAWMVRMVDVPINLVLSEKLGFILLPTLGMLGAFVGGSVTTSNLLFASIQLDLAASISLAPSLVLALQTAGATAGNMLSVSNIALAVQAASLVGREREVLVKLISWAFLYYCLVLVSGMVFGMLSV